MRKKDPVTQLFTLYLQYTAELWKTPTVPQDFIALSDAWVNAKRLGSEMEALLKVQMPLLRQAMAVTRETHAGAGLLESSLPAQIEQIEQLLLQTEIPPALGLLMKYAVHNSDARVSWLTAQIRQQHSHLQEQPQLREYLLELKEMQTAFLQLQEAQPLLEQTQPLQNVLQLQEAQPLPMGLSWQQLQQLLPQHPLPPPQDLPLLSPQQWQQNQFQAANKTDIENNSPAEVVLIVASNESASIG